MATGAGAPEGCWFGAGTGPATGGLVLGWRDAIFIGRLSGSSGDPFLGLLEMKNELKIKSETALKEMIKSRCGVEGECSL